MKILTLILMLAVTAWADQSLSQKVLKTAESVKDTVESVKATVDNIKQTFENVHDTIVTVQKHVENIQVVIEKLSSKTLIDASKQVVSIIQVSAKNSEKVSKFVTKVLNTEKFEKLAKALGPYGDAVVLALALFSEEAEDRFDKYFKEVLERFDVVDAKLDEISDKVITH